MPRGLFVSLSMVISVVVLGIFVQTPAINGFRAAMFADMVYGRAHKPYVYRLLLPFTVRMLASAVPEETRAAINDSLADDAARQQLFTKLRWEKQHLTEYCIALFLMFLSLLGFPFALRYFARSLYRAPALYTDAVCLTSLASLPLFFKYYSHLYDFPTLLLFALGLGLMAQARWLPFLLVFALGCLNKETVILLTVAFVIHYGVKKRLNRRSLATLLAWQVGIFVWVKVGLLYLFAHNVGESLLFTLFSHNLRLAVLFPAGRVILWACLFVALGSLALYRWHKKPEFLKSAAWIAVPHLTALALFGFLDEWRVYYELYPIVVLLLAHSLSAIFGIGVTNIADSAAHQPSRAAATS